MSNILFWVGAVVPNEICTSLSWVFLLEKGDLNFSQKCVTFILTFRGRRNLEQYKELYKIWSTSTNTEEKQKL